LILFFTENTIVSMIVLFVGSPLASIFDPHHDRAKALSRVVAVVSPVKSSVQARRDGIRRWPPDVDSAGRQDVPIKGN